MSHDKIKRRYPTAMRNPREYDARAVRDTLLMRGGPTDSGFLRYAFRPFDNRWLYWEMREKLVDRPRPEYRPHVFEGNLWLVSQQKPRREWSPPQVISHIGCLDLMDRGATCVPVWLRDDGLGSGSNDEQRRPNLSAAAQSCLNRLGANVEDLFHYVLAVLHAPAYRVANAGALRMEWPRIPLPGWPGGSQEGDMAAMLPEQRQAFFAMAAHGRGLAQLLDPDTPVPGVTTGTLRPELAAIAVPSTTDGRNMAGDDFAVTAGWGRFGVGQAVMPGTGRAVERYYTAEERAARDGSRCELPPPRWRGSKNARGASRGHGQRWLRSKRWPSSSGWPRLMTWNYSNGAGHWRSCIVPNGSGRASSAREPDEP